MKALTLILLSALFGVAVHIQSSAPEPPPVELAMVTDWPSPIPMQQAQLPQCRAVKAAVFGWWPVADYFLSAILVGEVFSDPLFTAGRRCV